MPNLVILGQMIRTYVRRSARKIGPLAYRHSRSLKVIVTDTDRSATRDFLLVIRSSLTMGLSYRFRDKRRFQLKIAKFSRPRVSNVHADSRWNFGGGAQKRDWCAYQNQPREGQTERQKWYNNIALCVPAHATLILMFCSSFWD